MDFYIVTQSCHCSPDQDIGHFQSWRSSLTTLSSINFWFLIYFLFLLYDSELLKKVWSILKGNSNLYNVLEVMTKNKVFIKYWMMWWNIMIIWQILSFIIYSLDETELQCGNLVKFYPNLSPANWKAEPPHKLASVLADTLPGNIHQYRWYPIEQQRVKLEGILETEGSN